MKLETAELRAKFARFAKVVSAEPDLDVDVLAERFGVDVQIIYRWTSDLKSGRTLAARKSTERDA